MASLRTIASQLLPPLAALLLSATTVASLSFANGGYYPSSWSWGTLVLLWVAVIALVATEVEQPGRAGLAFLAGLSGLAALSAASAAWSPTATNSLLAAQRVGLYAALAAAAIVVVRKSTVTALLAGCWLGGVLVCAYALMTRLLPDRFGVSDAVAGVRLAAPVGYWNALGCLAAVTALLALGLSSRARHAGIRALAAATVPLLLTTLYFTFSRASIVAGAAGLAAAVALDPQRLRFAAGALVALAPSVAVLALAWSSSALGGQDQMSGPANAQAHRIALVLMLAMLASAAAVLIFANLEKRVQLPRPVRLAFMVLLLILPLVALSAPVLRYGSPGAAIRSVWRAFDSQSTTASSDARSHLLSFSGSGRPIQYRMALRDFHAHPLFGSGAGTYERYWLLHRGQPDKVKNVHSLYLETLAELGALGLALLLLGLAAPLCLWRKVRRHPFGAAALGAYVTGLVHTGVDWDWQLTGVTTAVLLIGVALIRCEASTLRVSRLRTHAATAVLTLLLVPAFVALIGNTSVSKSAAAARAGDWSASERLARRATTWAPWSTQGWLLLGEAQIGAGNAAEARVSLRKALAEDPGDWNLWFDLARASEGRAQVAALSNARRLNPLSPEVAAFRQELTAQSQIAVTVR
jgi:hypothetical protein